MGSQILLIFITTRWLSLHSLHWSLEYTVMNFYTFKLFQYSIFLQLSPSTSNSCSRSQVKYRNSFDTKYQSLWCSLKWAEMFWYFNINMQIWTWWFLDQTHQIWWRIFRSTHESINIILGAIQINFPNVSIIYPQSWNKFRSYTLEVNNVRCPLMFSSWPREDWDTRTQKSHSLWI